MATQPNIMKMAWAKNGAKVTIPETTSTLGVASLSQGFPTETSLPIGDGGVPPRREDFNGAFNMLSMFAMFQQSGGQFSWSAQVDYDLPSIIYHNGDLWWCLRSNGVSSTIVEPGTDNTYWIKFKSYISSPLDAYPVGSYYISSESTNPANLPGFEGSVWTQVKDRVILAKGDKFTGSANSTGGKDTVKLAVGNIPSHTHTVSGYTTYVEAHTHKRGTMDIKGTFAGGIDKNNSWSGAFYKISGIAGMGDQDGTHYKTGFEASRNWTGETSEAGRHRHSISLTTGGTGSGTAFSIMNPYIIAYVWRRTA